MNSDNTASASGGFTSDNAILDRRFSVPAEHLQRGRAADLSASAADTDFGALRRRTSMPTAAMYPLSDSFEASLQSAMFEFNPVEQSCYNSIQLQDAINQLSSNNASSFETYLCPPKTESDFEVYMRPPAEQPDSFQSSCYSSEEALDQPHYTIPQPASPATTYMLAPLSSLIHSTESLPNFPQPHRFQYPSTNFDNRIENCDPSKPGPLSLSTSGRPTKFKPTESQLSTLVAVFEKNPFPSAALRNSLAQRLSIQERQVRFWFQNRRATYKINGVHVLKPKKAKVGSDADELEAEAAHLEPITQENPYFYVEKGRRQSIAF
ncbi:hypothetical protein BJ741DRAFT_618004 [Chytriomyces cf. hyalinus JEL632]|nr:hypothetical protein BJ741DRAFT_618004 [Chytriomyces cf. hyalinus JEL632]